MYPEKKLAYPVCPKCKQSAYMQKDGKNPVSLSQGYHCTKCELTYTPDRTINGYSSDVRHKAIQMCHIMSVIGLQGF